VASFPIISTACFAVVLRSKAICSEDTNKNEESTYEFQDQKTTQKKKTRNTKQLQDISAAHIIFTTTATATTTATTVLCKCLPYLGHLCDLDARLTALCGDRRAPQLGGAGGFADGHLVLVHDAVAALVQRVCVGHLEEQQKQQKAVPVR
jgi:hypothetical protein